MTKLVLITKRDAQPVMKNSTPEEERSLILQGYVCAHVKVKGIRDENNNQKQKLQPASKSKWIAPCLKSVIASKFTKKEGKGYLLLFCLLVSFLFTISFLHSSLHSSSHLLYTHLPLLSHFSFSLSIPQTNLHLKEKSRKNGANIRFSGL